MVEWRKRGKEDLRFYLNGYWEAKEFAEFLGHVEFLYDIARFANYVRVGGQRRYLNLFMPFEYRMFPFKYTDRDLDPGLEGSLVRREMARLADELDPRPNGRVGSLRIAQLHLASPGISDLTGVGRIVKEVRLFAMDIIDRILQADDRKIARETAREDLLAKKIANADKLLKLSEKVDLSSEDKQALVKQIIRSDNFLEGKLLEGKITNVEASDF